VRKWWRHTDFPVPLIQYCARCNADQWHDVLTHVVPKKVDHYVAYGTEAYAYSCKVCGHNSNHDASCRHSPACVAPGTLGANTSPQIRAELARRQRQANRRKWALGIPAIVAAVAFIVCAGVWFVRFARDRDDKATGQPAAGRSAHCERQPRRRRRGAVGRRTRWRSDSAETGRTRSWIVSAGVPTVRSGGRDMPGRGGART